MSYDPVHGEWGQVTRSSNVDGHQCGFRWGRCGHFITLYRSLSCVLNSYLAPYEYNAEHKVGKYPTKESPCVLARYTLCC
jgi:hypothetical protein